MDRLPDRSTSQTVPLLLLLAVYLIVAALAIPLVRWQLNPDGISYLEIAQRYADGELREAVNAYWSPLFSWLLVPILWSGITGPLAGKVLTFGCGAALITGLWMLTSRMTRDTWIRISVVGTSVAPIAAWASAVISPDLLVTALLILYFLIIFPSNGMLRSRRAFWGGIMGGVLYLAKSYALPFVAAHLLILTIVRARNASKRDLSAAGSLGPPVVALAGLLVVCLPWILILGFKSGHLTTGSSGSHNLGLVGPGNGPAGSENHPIKTDGLFPPVDGESLSVWSDPSALQFPPWPGPAASIDHLRSLIGLNLGKLLAFLWRTSSLAIPILATALVFLRAKLFGDRQQDLVRSLSLAVGLYVGGYLLIMIHDRYVWIVPVLALMMAAAIADVIVRRVPGQRPIVMTFLGLLWLSFTVPALGSLAQLSAVNSSTAELASELQSKDVTLAGSRLASDSRWEDALRLSYYMGSQYYGQFASDDADQVLREMNRFDIDAVIVWSAPQRRPAYLKGWSLAAASAETPYSLYRRAVRLEERLGPAPDESDGTLPIDHSR